MKETIPGMELLPSGAYMFEVVGIPEKIPIANGKFKRVWQLAYTDANGIKKSQKFFLFASQYYPFILAIGGVKKGVDIDWDDSEVDGRCFSCDLKIVKSKDGKYDNYVFENCKDEIPF